MLRKIRLRWVRRRKARAAIRLALDACRQVHPERELWPGGSIFHEGSAFVVGQVGYGSGGLPPNRCWWRVSESGECRELTHEQANAIRPVPEVH